VVSPLVDRFSFLPYPAFSPPHLHESEPKQRLFVNWITYHALSQKALFPWPFLLFLSLASCVDRFHAERFLGTDVWE